MVSRLGKYVVVGGNKMMVMVVCGSCGSDIGILTNRVSNR